MQVAMQRVSNRPTDREEKQQAGGADAGQAGRWQGGSEIPVSTPGKQVAGQTYRWASRQGVGPKNRQVVRRTRGLCRWPHGPKALGISPRASRSSPQLLPHSRARRPPLPSGLAWPHASPFCVSLSEGTSNHLNPDSAPAWPPASLGLSHT